MRTIQELVNENIPPAEWSKYQIVQPQTKQAVQRCELCGDAYPGERPPMGTPCLCKECKKPGTRIRKCACGKKIHVARNAPKKDKDGTDIVYQCKRCEQCVMCGTKESDQVCARCVIEDEVVTCTGCFRLPMDGSAFCWYCDRDYKAKNAGQFPGGPPPSIEPRAIQEHQMAVEQAQHEGNTALVERLTKEPDLVPALPGR